jgi:hypothetical protein
MQAPEENASLGCSQSSNFLLKLGRPDTFIDDANAAMLNDAVSIQQKGLWRAVDAEVDPEQTIDIEYGKIVGVTALL